VPAATAPCLISRFADGSQSVSCALEADQQPASVSYSGAIGLVPDAVDSVTLTMTDGATRVMPVENNVWTAPDDAAKAAYSLGGRVVEVELMYGSWALEALLLDAGRQRVLYGVAVPATAGIRVGTRRAVVARIPTGPVWDRFDLIGLRILDALGAELGDDEVDARRSELFDGGGRQPVVGDDRVQRLGTSHGHQ